MVKLHLEKRKWLLLITVVVLAVILPLAGFQSLVGSHMYPQDAFHESSNLSVRGVITSIQDHYKIDGMTIGSYHIFYSYIRINITGIVWVKENLANWITVDYGNDTVNGWNTVGIGYDNLDNPQLEIGQTVECKGCYVPHTDSPYSYIITISPSISGSYLKTEIT